MIPRILTFKIIEYLDKYPIITLTGVRQCGKSTLLKNILPNYQYVSLEDIDIREFAKNDPRGFLNQYNEYCIFDEVQRVPDLFSYLQSKVDKDEKMGNYILSGSHNFQLMEKISQSLAGRTAVLNLAPFSLKELKESDNIKNDVYEIMYKGFYPALYSRNIEPNDYFPSYIMTYIERDVRLIRNIPNSDDFIKFIRILATRSGQILNLSDISKISGISIPTIRAWISVLKQSYIIYTLQPYYNNYSKRIVKSPKLYFYDTGLLCHMLNISSAESLKNSEYKGAIFETMVISEYIKSQLFSAKIPQGYYWRDSNQNEVDLLTEDDGLKAYEVKLGNTMDRKYLKGLKKFSEISGLSLEDIFCIYTGDKSFIGTKGSFVRYDDVF